MSLELEDRPVIDEMEEDREGCEYIDGEWVPKHPPTLPEEVDRKGCEYIDGQWVEKPMSTASGIVEMTLSITVGGFIVANNLGTPISSAAQYKLFPNQKRIRKPDMSFIRPERQYAPTMSFPPDLAVEVISPTDVADDVETKLDEYLRAGVRLVWLVYIPTKNVWAYRPDGTAKLYRSGDTLSGEDVIPGFSMPVADVFRRI